MIAQNKGGKLIAACSNPAYRPVDAVRTSGKMAVANIGDQAANALAYSVSKGGIRSLTQCCALELAKYNINVRYTASLVCTLSLATDV
jgi:NAD(P)-dependent dehydrogenase (short-subunit alcohol dehydrogenase family)